jgi:uncharacterized protein YhbP (UPF0306 family)
MTIDTSRAAKSIPNEVVGYLRLHHIVTLSTSSFTGMPHADTVVYSNDEYRLFFFAMDGTQMVRNIKDSRYVSFTIDDYTTDWRKVRELQGVGQCRAASAQEDDWAMSLCADKFGAAFAHPAGVLYRIVPNEMHFVDYDYATVTADQAPNVHRRLFQIEGAPAPPSHGAVATHLDQLVYEPGQVIFRPGDSAGQYYVVVEGEVEIRGEGFGADQTVIRVGRGQLFGDQTALQGQRGVFTAHAVQRSVLLAVERSSIRDMLRSGSVEP